jgi:hypothetical protein
MASIAAQKAKAEAAGMTFQEYLEMEAANDPRRKGYVTCPANFFGPGAPGRDLKNPHTEHLAGYIGASVSNGGW